MASAPLNWLLKIGGATLKTTAKTLSEAVNTLHDTVTNLGTTVTNLGTTVTNLGTSKADASTTTTALNNLETNKLNISDLLSLEEIEASTSLTGKGATAESIKSLNNSLGGLQFAQDNEGNWGYIPSGADTVTPFSNGSLEYIDGGMVKKSRENDVASISKSYTAQSKCTLIIFCSITYTKSMSESIKLNGNKISPNFTKSAYEAYISLYSIPVEKGDSINLSLSATNSASYGITTSYFMAFVK